jgi:hypothetical protein
VDLIFRDDVLIRFSSEPSSRPTTLKLSQPLVSPPIMAPNDPEIAAPAESSSTTKAAKYEPGASWKNQETQQIPKNRIAIVFSGLMACIFLAAIDQVSELCAS